MKYIPPGDVAGGFSPPPKDEPHPDAIGMMYIEASVETWEQVLAIAKANPNGRGLIAVRIVREEAIEAISKIQKLLRDANN